MVSETNASGLSWWNLSTRVSVCPLRGGELLHPVCMGLVTPGGTAPITRAALWRQLSAVGYHSNDKDALWTPRDGQLLSAKGPREYRLILLALPTPTVSTPIRRVEMEKGQRQCSSLSSQVRKPENVHTCLLLVKKPERDDLLKKKGDIVS